MKKTFFLALFLMCSVVWNAAGAAYSFDSSKGLITSVDQFSANSIEIGDGDGFAALIDGNTGTHFHSAYNTSKGSTLPDAEHYLQVDLSSSPVAKFFFTFNGRSGDYHDTPTDITFEVSNDGVEWSAETVVLKNLIEGNPTEVAYTSEMVDLGAEYKYIRMIVNKTTSGRTEGTYNRYFWNLTEFQIYTAEEVAELVALVNKIKSSDVNYVIGTDPGCYPEAKYTAFTDALQKAETAIANNAGNDEQKQLETALQAALEDLNNSKIGISDGYYNFVNAFPTFKANQGVEKAMGANDASLNWGTFEPKNAAQLFKVTNLGNDTYSVQNVLTGKYVNTVPGRSATVPVSDEQTTAQVFVPLPNTNQFNLANTANSEPYHPAGHSGGSGVSGNIVGWPGGANSQSAWVMRQVTDESLLSELLAAGKTYQTNKKAAAMIQAGNAVYSEIATPMITNATDNDEACQFSSNAKEPKEGAFANLIDGKGGTYCHTLWSQAGPNTPHNLQVNLGRRVGGITFMIKARENSNTPDTPNDITILVTNDEALGADPNSADADWIEVTHMTENMAEPGAGLVYYSPYIPFTRTYQYVRFVVNGTTTGRANSTTGMKFFCISEFQVYSRTTNSVYANNPEMPAYVRQMSNQIANVTKKLNDGTVTDEDLTALQTAIDAVKDASLGSNAESVAPALEEAYQALKKVYDFGDIVTDVNQISSNAQSGGDGSSYANLIDGSTGNVFHTVWDDAFGNDSNPPTSGSGWHNIQFSLKEAVDKFYFNYIGRTGSDWHDNPNDISVYVTNDDALGASTANAETEQWKHIADLTEGFPGDVAGAEYESPLFSLGDAYKYIRLVVHHATHTDVVPSRHFAAPEISGVTWNVSEMHVFGGEPAATSEYNKVEAMKAAGDALNEVIASTEAKMAKGMARDADAEALKAAVEAVNNAYVDRNAALEELAKVINTANTTYDNAIGELTPIIKDAAQMSTNSLSMADAGSLPNLIDGNTETILHSIWNGAMKDANVTAESWQATLDGLDANSYVKNGIGYHNLQVKFDNGVSQFRIKYIGRNNSTWSDSPNDIIIYGTNDTTLGGSTLAAESSKWTEITRLTEGFPPVQALAPYTSPLIDLGASYKFIRFEMRNTNNFGKQSDRTFVKPEITGVTWDVSEFQLYDIADQASLYCTNANMKSAVNDMKKLADAYAGLTAKDLNFDEVTKLNEAIQKVKGVENSATIQPILEEAYKTRDKVDILSDIVTDVNQISSNAQSGGDGSSYANLIDGGTDNVFHTVWDDAFGNDSNPPTSGSGWHNIQFSLKEAVNKFYFNYIGRTGSDWHDNPNDISVYVTNDDALGASTANAETEQWKHIADLTEGFPGDVAGAEYESPIFRLGDAYKYIRLVVHHATHTDVVPSRHFAAPGISGVTWNVSEMHVYGTPALPTSQYYTVKGMKEAADALDVAIANVTAKVEAGTTTDADIQNLKEAIAAVNALYIDHKALKSELAVLIDSANAVYSQAVGELVPLIKSADQMSTNSLSMADGGSCANLIDGNTESVFHSVWHNAMREAEGTASPITEQSWQEVLNNLGGNYITNGIGYHNLQVKFDDPVSKFSISYIGRNNASWCDSPNDIIIYGTNDETLGNSTLAAESAKWTEITRLTEGFPEVQALAPYSSPLIDLGGAYKFIRFEMRNTNNFGKQTDRTFNTPEITGITWDLSEFQMYYQANTENLKYNSDATYKNNIDAMKALADADNSLDQESVMPETVEALRAAIKKALASNTGDMEELVQQAKAVREKANDREELIKNAGQMSTNSLSMADGGSCANLIDGDTESVFHSVWHNAMREAEGTASPITEQSWQEVLNNLGDSYITNGIGYHNLQVKFDDPVSKFRFSYIGRNNASWCDSPNDIIIYGTNDETLGNSTLAAESAKWTEITRLTEGFPEVQALAPYSSPEIDLGGAYKFIRFEMRNTNNFGKQTDRTFNAPEITGITWDLSEFQILGDVLETSQYYKVEGMKDACDLLDAIIASSEEKAASSTATDEDMSRLQAAMKAVQKLFVDRDALDAELAALVEEGTKAINEAKGANQKLITDAAQFSSNNRSIGDYGTFEGLIDGDTHYTHNFHSIWNEAGMKAETITADEWRNILNGLGENSPSVGVGYHNLQVKFNSPVSNIRLNYIGRTGTSFTDTPNNYELYVTNNDALGASVDQADLANSDWKLVASAQPELEDAQGVVYNSEVYELGGKYKYARFVVKGTTHQGKHAARTFNNPDITGITWNIGEFQMYTNLDEESSMYNTSASVKDAADELSPILSESASRAKHTTYADDIEELREAVEALKQAIKDKLDGIKSVATPEAQESEIVNVYTIDGKLVKANVNAKNAKKGLTRGIYIIGKKKVSIK